MLCPHPSCSFLSPSWPPCQHRRAMQSRVSLPQGRHATPAGSARRPSEHQRRLCNGHKRKHAIKFQSVMAPDGLTIHLSKPLVGCRHDAFILQESGLLEVLRRHCRVDDVHYCIHGDPAYPRSAHLYRPYLGNNLRPEEQQFNEKMSRVREAMDRSFATLRPWTSRRI
jgi:hypothetical protein